MQHLVRRVRSWCPLLTFVLSFVAAAPLHAQSSPGAAPAALARDWRVLRTPAFTVLSEGNDDNAREVARRLEAFRDAVRLVFPAARFDSLVPTYVVVFASPQSFARFRPMRDGRRERWVAGYALFEDDANYLVLGRTRDATLTWNIVFHEYAHYVLHRTFAVVPHWYDEGVAELFGGLAGTDRDSRAYVGRPLPYRVASLLAEGGPLLLREMLVDARAAKWQRSSPSRFYATAWIMSHFFLMDPERRSQLLALFKALADGAAVEDAVRTAFGVGIEALDDQLARYSRRPTLPVLGLKGLADRDTGAAVDRIAEADLARLQANLLLGVDDRKGADALVRKAMTDAPEHDGLRTAAARVKLADDAPEAALTVLASAGAARSSDSLQAEAEALVALGRFDDAVARLQSAEALGSGSPGLKYAVGHAHMARGSWPQATLAFTQLTQMDPRPEWDMRRAYDAYTLGYGVYAAGAARTYISKVGWSSPATPYVAFAGWLGLRKDKRDADAARLLADVAAATSGTAWPSPIVTFMQGTLGSKGLLDAASDARERTEAHAYIGLLASTEGRTDEAREHLTWVQRQGDDTLIEHEWAVAALKRLPK